MTAIKAAATSRINRDMLLVPGVSMAEDYHRLRRGGTASAAACERGELQVAAEFRHGSNNLSGVEPGEVGSTIALARPVVGLRLAKRKVCRRHLCASCRWKHLPPWAMILPAGAAQAKPLGPIPASVLRRTASGPPIRDSSPDRM